MEGVVDDHETTQTNDAAVVTKFRDVDVSSLQSALQSGDATLWSATLNAMSKGTYSINMYFRFNYEGWKGITAEKAVCLIDHLPPTVTKLWIYNANFGVDFVDSVSNYIRTTSKLDYLELDSTRAGGEDGRQAGSTLTQFIISVNLRQ